MPVGGGKDSIVTIETLKRAAQPMTLFSLSPTSGPVQPIADTISRSHLPAVNVARRLAPELKAVNDAGAYNGHVPITAILLRCSRHRFDYRLQCCCSFQRTQRR